MREGSRGRSRPVSRRLAGSVTNTSGPAMSNTSPTRGVAPSGKDAPQLRHSFTLPSSSSNTSPDSACRSTTHLAPLSDDERDGHLTPIALDPHGR